jgi:hypothetical protein
VIRTIVVGKSGEGWAPLLVAGSIAASLLVAPVAQAEEQAASEQSAPAEVQGGWNPSYPAPGAVPPPPGPYTGGAGGVPPQFRPDQDLETAQPGDYAPGMPPRFQDDRRRGPVTREEFLAEQEEHRKQMDQYRQQRQAEMEQRRSEMDAQREAWRAQRGEDDPCAQERAQWREQMQKEREQRRAEQDQRIEQMKAEQEQRIGSAPYPGAPMTPPTPPEPPAPPVSYAPPAPAAEATTEQVAPQQAPAYGYPAPPPGYGYGYPPRPGYSAPGWGYPGYPAPAAGGTTPAGQVE